MIYIKFSALVSPLVSCSVSLSQGLFSYPILLLLPVSPTLLYHYPFILVNLPYKQLDPVPGVIPLSLGRPRLLLKIPLTGPSHFQLPNLQIWPRLQKVQSHILQVRGCLPLPDIDPLHLLGPVPQVPRQILNFTQVPLIPLPHTHHILLRLLSPKSPISTLPHLSLLSKYPLSFPPHLLENFPPFNQLWFLSPKPPFPSSNSA